MLPYAQQSMYASRMGPHRPDPPFIAGVDNAVDQVERKYAFIERHPDITITSPRENGSALYRASRGDDGEVIEGAAHEDLRVLLDYLEARFDRGRSG